MLYSNKKHMFCSLLNNKYKKNTKKRITLQTQRRSYQNISSTLNFDSLYILLQLLWYLVMDFKCNERASTVRSVSQSV